MPVRGRPTVYTEEIAHRILDQLSDGIPLRHICADKNMPPESTVRTWAIDDPAFAALYARARNMGLDAQAEALTTISDDPAIDPNARRVMVDTRKWIFSKMRPDKYGDRTVIAGDPDNPLNVNVTQSAELLTNRIDRLIARSETESVPGEPE